MEQLKPTRQSPAEAMKKSLGSPLKPTVPGPRESARTLTSEKAPDIMPKPRPTTENEKIIEVSGSILATSKLCFQ